MSAYQLQLNLVPSLSYQPIRLSLQEVGLIEGIILGKIEGLFEGTRLGFDDGFVLGFKDGTVDGGNDGLVLGIKESMRLGSMVGSIVVLGLSLGIELGALFLIPPPQIQHSVLAVFPKFSNESP